MTTIPAVIPAPLTDEYAALDRRHRFLLTLAGDMFARHRAGEGVEVWELAVYYADQANAVREEMRRVGR